MTSILRILDQFPVPVLTIMIIYFHSMYLHLISVPKLPASLAAICNMH